MLKGVDYMKKIIPWMLATAVIMLVFPWLAVTFIKGDGGMAVCFILFFAVPSSVLPSSYYISSHPPDYSFQTDLS